MVTNRQKWRSLYESEILLQEGAIYMAEVVTRNKKLLDWVNEVKELCTPQAVHWCDGSEAEKDLLIERMLESKMLQKLNPQKRPDSYWAGSDPRDVARVEDRTFICSERESDAGPSNNWREPSEMRETLKSLFKGSMAGRTMYVVPFSMGPIGSKFSIIGVEITDSAYVAVSMGIMARMGTEVLKALGDDGEFVPALHSVGAPLQPGQQDVRWPCNPDNRYIVHFPETREIWSFGSGYGGNALLGKKCLALRIASVVAHDEGWLAEHMLILKLTSPQGAVKYVAGAFPSACGKTNLAMVVPTLPGWSVETVGDDICWMRFGEDGQLWAVNPEAGFFGVAPGTSEQTNPNALHTLSKETIFTNTALTSDGDVWWEGLTDEPPADLIDWKGNPWSKDSATPASHPNARFTVSVKNGPSIASEWEDPRGVPISAILFGGRRASLVPLVTEARDWEHGIFLGSVLASETTAAADGKVGNLRRDPFAMLPFCGYNMADYFGHWLRLGAGADQAKLPKIFLVNWFRRSEKGKFLWPGYGDNSRVLEWVAKRVDGSVGYQETALGRVPTIEGINTEGLAISEEALKELVKVDADLLIDEVDSIREHYSQFGERLPSELAAQLSLLAEKATQV